MKCYNAVGPGSESCSSVVFPERTHVLYSLYSAPRIKKFLAELLSQGAHSPRGDGGMIVTSPIKEIDASSLLSSFGGSWLLDMNLRHSSTYSPQRFDGNKRQEITRANNGVTRDRRNAVISSSPRHLSFVMINSYISRGPIPGCIRSEKHRSVCQGV